jgi:hypothetical protein
MPDLSPQLTDHVEGGIKYTSTIDLSEEGIQTATDKFKIPALIKDKKQMMYATMNEFTLTKGDGLPRKTLLKEGTQEMFAK